MLATIYPVSFVIAFAGLLIWSSWAENKSVATFGRLLLLTGIVSWFSTIAISTVEWEDKFWIISRDLLVLGIGGTLALWTRSNRTVNLFLLLSIVFFLNISYIPVLEDTFAVRQGTMNPGNMDPNGEWLVKIEPQKLVETRLMIHNQNGELLPAFEPLDHESTDLDEIYVVDLPSMSGKKLDKLKRTLIHAGLVDWIEANEVVEVSIPEGDTETPSKFKKALTNDPDLGKLWSFETFDAPSLYKVLSSKLIKPNKTSLLAILDTGIDGEHEDLKDNYVSTKTTYDRDVRGHGTHCAGIAGAVSNNKIGIASFAPDQRFFRITSIKVLSDLGFGSQATTIKGMIEAADLGADVISMSLGAPSTDERQRAYGEAVNYCLSKGAIVVVAAGNASTNAIHYSPANTPGVIAVSAIDENHHKTIFSNTTQDIQYAVAAPGLDIYSTYPRNRYRNMSGTSMATPYVSSLVAIMKSIDPDLKVKQIYEVLDGTGLPTNKTELTGKIIQPAEALRVIID